MRGQGDHKRNRMNTSNFSWRYQGVGCCLKPLTVLPLFTLFGIPMRQYLMVPVLVLSSIIGGVPIPNRQRTIVRLALLDCLLFALAPGRERGGGMQDARCKGVGGQHER